ncbi:hypothetical protein BLNAU_9651 [Blattamonas nauphoetae]|uniref:Protein kinase domain-containing protein n=1 Tax=Blattamonas nauphoetae TaxID=2049346 RepID=A0ABQ9XVB2_9EUKA|nr:hypothetical protein BLNAU_9651 [Blattamonas nauphoetae]
MCCLGWGDIGGAVVDGPMKTASAAEYQTMKFWGPEMYAVGEGKAVSVSQAGDMWAFGLIVLQLLTGQEWISGTNGMEIGESVRGFDVGSVCKKAKIEKSVEPVLCLLLHKNPQLRLSSAELIRSSGLRSILGSETPLSQFLREELETTRSHLDTTRTELDTTKLTVGKLQSKLSESESKVAQLEQKCTRLEKEIGQLRTNVTDKEPKQKEEESEQLRRDLRNKAPKLKAKKKSSTQPQQTIQKTKADVATNSQQIVASDVIVAFSPDHFRVSGSTVRRINSTSWVGCFTKPVSKGIHRMSITKEAPFVMFGVCDAAEYPNYLKSTVFESPKAAMMDGVGGDLRSASLVRLINTPPQVGQEWSAEADLEKRTLHFFIDGVQQEYYFGNIPVPLVFALDVFMQNTSVGITFWGELKKSKTKASSSVEGAIV